MPGPNGPQFSNSKLNPSNLSSAMGEPKVGRREKPEAEDPWVKRKVAIVGILVGLAVVVILFFLMVFLGQSITLPVDQ